MKIKITSKNGILPAYETKGSAGMDLSACLTDPVTIFPGGRVLVPTGLRIQLPLGFEAQIRARSGLAVKYGIGLVNGIGTIDSDYRGEIKIPLINWGESPYVINNGDRIAQMVIARYEIVEWDPVDSLEETERGTGGFGHTGQ